MKPVTRPRRFWWVVGILLLIGSTIGAGWALNGSALFADISPGQETRTAPVAAADPYDIVSALGFVDVEGGVAALYPVQPGRIVEVAGEGTRVKKGDIVLRLDNRFAQYTLDEAKADLKAAEEQLKKAQTAPVQHQKLIAQQQAAIEVAKHKKTVAEEELAVKERFFRAQQLTENEKRVYEEKVKIAEVGIRAEELKLEALQETDPAIDIARAEADVAAKKAQVQRAQLAVEECDLQAPDDGLVLRVMVTAGEVLGAAPTQPAITFCPDTPRIVRAEVLQEWASRVAVGQPVRVQDDTHEGPHWSGTVKSVSDWIAPKRQKILEPFMVNDVRTLECLIELDPTAPVRIGQRVRVKIDVRRGAAK